MGARVHLNIGSDYKRIKETWYLIGWSRRCVREGRTRVTTTIRWRDDGDMSEKMGTITTKCTRVLRRVGVWREREGTIKVYVKGQPEL